MFCRDDDDDAIYIKCASDIQSLKEGAQRMKSRIERCC